MQLRLILDIIAISLSIIMVLFLIYKIPEIIKKQKKGESPKYHLVIIGAIILYFIFLMITRLERL